MRGICDGRFCDDDLCEAHSEVGRMLKSARDYATHSPAVDWPSTEHPNPIEAIMAAHEGLIEAGSRDR